MSIRIYKLAQQIGIGSKALLDLLKKSRVISWDVKSVSSTVDNISASALREGFQIKTRNVAATVNADAEEAKMNDREELSKTISTSSLFDEVAPRKQAVEPYKKMRYCSRMMVNSWHGLRTTEGRR